MNEAKFQNQVRRDLEVLLPGCFIMKNDSELLQGIPDLIVLYKSKWAVLEVKADRFAAHQPNQDFYIDKFDAMSLAAFIFPENKESIFDELRRHFKPTRARVVAHAG